jgi:hypothetical protein
MNGSILGGLVRSAVEAIYALVYASCSLNSGSKLYRILLCLDSASAVLAFLKCKSAQWLEALFGGAWLILSWNGFRGSSLLWRTNGMGGIPSSDAAFIR